MTGPGDPRVKERLLLVLDEGNSFTRARLAVPLFALSAVPTGPNKAASGREIPFPR